MKKALILFLMFFGTTLFAEFHYSISPLSETIKHRILKGKSWRRGCPVSLQDLRYIRVTYWNFSGKEKSGELLMHKEAASDIVAIFGELYEIRYPVRQMRLVSDFGGNDWRSIEAGNTSAFNCRPATGSRKWSKHAYGRAIDLNPVENPYISKSGHIAHKASEKYRRRVHRKPSDPGDRALLQKRDKATLIFKKYGWKWGGDWPVTKDYQHFFKP